MTIMGKVTGFLEIDRQEQKYEPAADRIRHFGEFAIAPDDRDVARQAARCMDCGIPYCHGPTGCPLHNQIPDWNDLVYRGEWQEAARNLHSTNNFPEFTGRICPAPCESACTLHLEDMPVAIKMIEQSIADKVIEEGWIVPEPAACKTGHKVAIIGSGPAGLAAAQQLARVGHDVDILEREPNAGGLLRYGIPDFKMEKHLIDRRVEQMRAEGVNFHFNVNVGVDRPLAQLQAEYGAVLMCCGAEKPRDPKIPGMELEGCRYAMPFLVRQNRLLEGLKISDDPHLCAAGKRVIVVGGGDTASDCIGTSFRQGALSVTQMDIRPMPPKMEDKMTVWPYWPTRLRVSSSQAEGAEREFSAATMAIIGKQGVVTGVRCARVDTARQPIDGTEFVIGADLVLIAIGFSGPGEEGCINELGAALKRDARSNVLADDGNYQTSIDGLYSAGDMRRGQSLVVWAIREGRQAARAIDLALCGKTKLPL